MTFVRVVAGGGLRESPSRTVAAAQYFAFNVLPGVAAKAQLIAREDRSAVDIPVEAFA